VVEDQPLSQSFVRVHPRNGHIVSLGTAQVGGCPAAEQPGKVLRLAPVDLVRPGHVAHLWRIDGCPVAHTAPEDSRRSGGRRCYSVTCSAPCRTLPALLPWLLRVRTGAIRCPACSRCRPRVTTRATASLRSACLTATPRQNDVAGIDDHDTCTSRYMKLSWEWAFSASRG
jgi:hypothetical protein